MTVNNTGQSSCTVCPAGYQCNDPSISPVLCLAGTYATAGSKVCSSCALGTYSNGMDHTLLMMMSKCWR
jgi:hypothetical protein